MHDGSHRRFVVRNCFDVDFALAVAWSSNDIICCEFAHHRSEVVAELRANDCEFTDVAESWFVAAIAAPFDECLKFLGNEIKRRALRKWRWFLRHFCSVVMLR